MTQPWIPKPGDRVVRHPREKQLEPVKLTITSRRGQHSGNYSILALNVLLFAIVTAGTFLLILPVSNHGEGFTPFLDAFFTATSAVTLTGLTVQDTATYWSTVGQTIIILLIFLGGITFMTMATLMLTLVGKQVNLSSQESGERRLVVSRFKGLGNLAIRVMIVSTTIQTIGFICLLIRFWSSHSQNEAIWQAAFNAVSAFNNAGFVIFSEPENISVFRNDTVTLAIMGALILLGSIGYWVILDICKTKRFQLLSLNSKLVLVYTAVLLVFGSIMFWVSEYNNPNTLGRIPGVQTVIVSIFESISSRTAGLTTIDFNETKNQTKFFFAGLMFIGGATGSVAGGIKVNTLALLVVAISSTLLNHSESRVFGRTIPHSQVQRGMSLSVLSISTIFFTILVLTLISPSLFEDTNPGFEFVDLLFETISAFSTTGLTTGLTRELSPLAQFVVILAMFIGRMGPLTISLFMLLKIDNRSFRNVEERITLG